PTPSLFPYTTLFRSRARRREGLRHFPHRAGEARRDRRQRHRSEGRRALADGGGDRRGDPRQRRLRAVNARDLPAATTVTMTLVFDTVAAWTDFTIGSNAAYQIDWGTGALPRAAGQALQSGDRHRSAIALRSTAPWRRAA